MLDMSMNRRNFLGMIVAMFAGARVPRLGGDGSKPLRVGSIPTAPAKTQWMMETHLDPHGDLVIDRLDKLSWAIWR